MTRERAWAVQAHAARGTGDGSKLTRNPPRISCRCHRKQRSLRRLGPGYIFPGVAVEMEWNNKDPFFDRDLSNFYALHRAGALAVGVIVTRGPSLQQSITAVARQHGLTTKYGASTTHWGKLMPRVDLGGGGECPLLLVGIEPERVDGL